MEQNLSQTEERVTPDQEWYSSLLDEWGLTHEFLRIVRNIEIPTLRASAIGKLRARLPHRHHLNVMHTEALMAMFEDRVRASREQETQ